MTWSKRLLFSPIALVAMTLPLKALIHAHRGPTSPKLSSRRSKQSPKPATQHVIDSARATEIQTALIKSGYLSGEPSGQWDASTQAAMQKLQADNGWQTKIIPDSRAIIKLGLGPSQDLTNTSSHPDQWMSSSSAQH